MSAELITWQTTHGDTVEVYPSYLETPLVDQDRGIYRWRYRVRAANNKIVETGSEGYTRKGAAIRAALRHHPRLGNDGLTDAERQESADRWRNGAGRAPSKDEMDELRRLTPVTHRDLMVEPEYFDHLAEDRPAQPDPKLVELFRSMRGEVEQR